MRVGIEAGDITYGDIISVVPYGNELCVVEVTGQQILDALEWSCRDIPGESGGFLQVSGLTLEIDAGIESGCIADENGMMTGIEGPRRVKNVKVNGEDIDPAKKYTVAGLDYILLDNGNGFTAFEGCTVLEERVMLDNQVLINYIVETLGGRVGAEYEEPTGQGRIVIIDGEADQRFRNPGSLSCTL
ncbi:MAG: 5'-nucleotidase C-terminal domain-containing protein [Lachnospiraceae bacterium]|nr:5'-nucleotidase C-terminal domain-containing protein [Lachnospiraceae bacterium]